MQQGDSLLSVISDVHLEGRSAPRRRENREQRKGTARAPANRGQPVQQPVPQYNFHYPPPIVPALNQWTLE